MVFTAVASGRDREVSRYDDSARRDASTRRAIDILNMVRGRVPGKDAVSHVFLRLFASSTTIQLVFAQNQGSLRLQLPVAAATAPPRTRLGMLKPTLAPDPGAPKLKPLDLFSTVSELFAQTEELRVHYCDNDDAVTAALASLPAAFPALKTLSLVQNVDWDRPEWQWQASRDAEPTLAAGLLHLHAPDTGSVPYPALETLWVSLERADEIGSIGALLSNRAYSRVPIRRVIVTVYAPMRADAGSDVPARLRELHTKKKVIVVELEEGSAGGLREVDWMVRLPVRFSLPSAIHRDWPVIRHGRN